MSEHTAENDAPFAWVDKWTHEPCPTRGMALCTITDPAHRHMGARMVPPLTLTVQAGAEPVSALRGLYDYGVSADIGWIDWDNRDVDASTLDPFQHVQDRTNAGTTERESGV